MQLHGVFFARLFVNMTAYCVFIPIKTLMKRTRYTKDEIIVDSRDVDRAIEISLNRKHDNSDDGNDRRAEIVDEEILVSTPKKKKS